MELGWLPLDRGKPLLLKAKGAGSVPRAPTAAWLCTPLLGSTSAKLNWIALFPL